MTDSRTKDKDTPTTGEVRDSLVYLNKYHAKQYGDVDLMVVGSETAAQFDRMIAEVERAAAEKALTDLADELSVPRKLWHGDSGVEVMVDERTLEMQKLTEWLRARAVALGFTTEQEREKR